MAELPQPGDLIASKYRIEHLLGQGGMGAVFAARHELMDKAVAMKWLHPELSGDPDICERFMGEARAAARMHHPNVVDVYDVGSHEGCPFLIMELLRGESFQHVMRNPNWPVTELLRLLIGAMEGVQAAHAKGIVHRDIKPDNIFVVIDEAHPAGLAKVVDFGISKLTEGARASSSVTQTGFVLGTPAYMSFEQMNGSKDVDGRTDVYAFGVLLYRALTGVLPFDGESLAAVAIQLATQTPVPLRQHRADLPVALETLVATAMARRREERFGSMQELVAGLRACTQELLGGAPPASASWPHGPGAGPPTPRSDSAGGPMLASGAGAAPTPLVSRHSEAPPALVPARRGALGYWALAAVVAALVGVGGWWLQAEAPIAAEAETASPQLPPAQGPAGEPETEADPKQAEVRAAPAATAPPPLRPEPVEEAPAQAISPEPEKPRNSQRKRERPETSRAARRSRAAARREKAQADTVRAVAPTPVVAKPAPPAPPAKPTVVPATPPELAASPEPAQPDKAAPATAPPATAPPATAPPADAPRFRARSGSMSRDEF